jgi:hypothetical protein
VFAGRDCICWCPASAWMSATARCSHCGVSLDAQIPALPSKLSVPLRRLLQSLVLDDASRRPSAVQAWRRASCLCFGPDMPVAAAVAEWDASQCRTWLRQRCIDVLVDDADDVGREVGAGADDAQVCPSFLELRW